MPHPDNQYRPHAIRRGWLASIVVIVLAVHVLGLFTERQVLGESTVLSADQLLTQTNTERKKVGLNPLHTDQKLSEAAHLKADDMLKKQYWAHVAPDGTQPWEWINKSGYEYAEAGENLARGYDRTDDVVRAWMASPKHRDNMLNKNYQAAGFAVVSGSLEGDRTTLIVALYGRPATGSGMQVFSAASQSPQGIFTTLGLAIQSVSPATLGGVALLLLLAGVALVAHAVRHNMPKHRRTHHIHIHHGAYKAGGLVIIAGILIATSMSAGYL